jgi:hypothetical protein
MVVPIASNWGPPDISGSINQGVDAVLGGIGNFRLQQELASLPRTADGSPDYRAAAVRLLGSNPVAAQQLMRMHEMNQLQDYRSRSLGIQERAADLAADKSQNITAEGKIFHFGPRGELKGITDIETGATVQPGAAPAAPAAPAARAAAAPSIPQEAIDRLKNNPQEADLFEKHYKLPQGSAQQYITGAAPAAPAPAAAAPPEQPQVELRQPPPGMTYNQKKIFREEQSKNLAKFNQEEVKKADDAVEAGRNALRSIGEMSELSKQSYGGFGASGRAAVASQFGNQAAINTQLLEQKITTTALEQLKATFGGNPTEGERKILLDVQGSVGKVAAVREQIFKDAAEAARRRVKYNQKYANAMRTGTYMNYGYTDNTPVD